MTTKTFKYGKYSCKSYKKTCGQGWEVCFTFAGHQVFVGNFIHAKEANAWYSMMNQEFRKFCKKYNAAPNAPVSWTCKFMANYMYKAYYSFLDREFSKYHRVYNQGFKKHARRYSHMHKTWSHDGVWHKAA